MRFLLIFLNVSSGNYYLVTDRLLIKLFFTGLLKLKQYFICFLIENIPSAKSTEHMRKCEP